MSFKCVSRCSDIIFDLFFLAFHSASRGPALQKKQVETSLGTCFGHSGKEGHRGLIFKSVSHWISPHNSNGLGETDPEHPRGRIRANIYAAAKTLSRSFVES